MEINPSYRLMYIHIKKVTFINKSPRKRMTSYHEIDVGDALVSLITVEGWTRPLFLAD